MTGQQQHSWIATLLPFVILGIIVVLRLRRMSGERKLDLKFIWAVPIVYLILIGFMLIALPPPIVGWELLLAGLLVGLLAGWYRGRLIHIHRDSDTGELRQRASPLAMILLLAIIVLKVGAREVFGETAASDPHSPAMLLTDAFIGFALGLLSATRIEVYTRARRILSAAE